MPETDVTEPSLPDVTSPNTFTPPTAPVFPTTPSVPSPTVTLPVRDTPTERSDLAFDEGPDQSTTQSLEEPTTTVGRKDDSRGTDESGYLSNTTSTVAQISATPKNAEEEPGLLINTAGAAIGLLAAACFAVAYVKMKRS